MEILQTSSLNLTSSPESQADLATSTIQEEEEKKEAAANNSADDA